MPESVFCHACRATTTSEAYFSDAGDRVCPACESEFIEVSEVAEAPTRPQANNEAVGQQVGHHAHGGGRNQGFHRHFTTPGGHNVHLHVVTSMGGLPAPLENLLNTAEPADLTALLRNMQGVNLTPFNLPPGVSPGDFGPNGGQALEDLMLQLAEAHQPQASPTSRDTLSALPRRKVRQNKETTDSEGFSNTPSDQPAACACGEPCSVCHDSMEEGLEVIELPCQHCYHEDCITAWLKEHNTCPVCRKELPVDEDLQRQQRQDRQQRLEQEMQRQPAGLQSFFSSLNPFHLFGSDGRANGNTGHVSSEELRMAGETRMPAATASRLERAERRLRDLQTQLQNRMNNSSGSQANLDRNSLQTLFNEVQFTDTMLANLADHARTTLWMNSADDSPTNTAADTAAVAEIAQRAAEAILAEVAEAGIAEDATATGDADRHTAAEHTPHASNDVSNDLSLPAEPAAPTAASSPAQGDSDSDRMPDLVNSENHSDSDDVLAFESDHDVDSVPDLESDHDSEGSDDLSAEGSDYVDDDGDEEDEDDSDDGDDALPSLVEITQPRLLFATEASQGANSHGVNPPLDLDQQAALDSLSRQLDRAESLIATVSQALDDAVPANQTASAEQPAAPMTASDTQTPESQPASAHSSAAHNSGSDQRRVVQRINSQSTPQNPAGPLQSQPSGLALATAPVSNPSGVILNQRSIDQASIDAELPRTASGLADLDPNGNKHAELRSHPLTQTPSRKRSFTPSEASSSLDGNNSVSQESKERLSAADNSLAVRSRDGDSRRSGGGLVGLASMPVQWAARSAGRLVGSIFRRSSRQ